MGIWNCQFDFGIRSRNGQLMILNDAAQPGRRARLRDQSHFSCFFSRLPCRPYCIQNSPYGCAAIVSVINVTVLRHYGAVGANLYSSSIGVRANGPGAQFPAVSGNHIGNCEVVNRIQDGPSSPCALRLIEQFGRGARDFPERVTPGLRR